MKANLMPSKCWVPGCRSNYNKSLKATVFSFPQNEALKEIWIKTVRRSDNKRPSKASKICERHFKPEDIVTEAIGFDSKTKTTIKVPLQIYRLKPEAVPSIFKDRSSKRLTDRSSPTTAVEGSCSELVDELQDFKSSDGLSMQNKGKSACASRSSANVLNNTCKQNDAESRGSVTPKKVEKAAPTTDRPIITIIKAKDSIANELQIPDEKMDEEHSNSSNEKSNSSSCSNSLPSPYKNLPTVTVCLKEEDRVIIPKELRKVVKRSPSTGSNSSNGSSEASKISLQPKRRKIEKPAPTVIGRQNDCYCWVCHRENILLCCIACPRAYHPKCAGELNELSSDWVCPECRRLLAAENVDSRSATLAEISLDKLCALLKLSLNKMKHRAPVAFHQPVSLEHYPLYPHYVIHPMDFSLLEKNIKQKLYGCTEAFLADVKWILHNSCVFNGTQHPLSTNAKSMVKTCEHDMQEIEVCPDCFMHSVIRNKYWFSEVCRKPHPLVWAKLKGFPYWPAKVVRILDGNVDARFFGAHDRAWVPIVQCYHLSKEMPTTSKPKKKGNYESALDELNVHVHLLIQKFGTFEYAPYRTSFNPQNKSLMYHGIDSEKIEQEETSFDASPMKNEFNSSIKTVSVFSDSESEKKSNNDGKVICEQSKALPLKALEATENASSNSVLSIGETQLITKKSDDTYIEEKRSAPVGVFEISDENAFENAKKSDVVNVKPATKSHSISDSDQLRKLELALERIKGYVASGNDAGKDSNKDPETEPDANEKAVTDHKKDDKIGDQNVADRSLSSQPTDKPNPLETFDLPCDIPNGLANENNVQILDSTKKNDSFSLKLNETIQSCKAKLGISEILEDEVLTDSESVEEEDENASLSEEEGSDDSSSQSEDESNSELSDTDIETVEETEEGVSLNDPHNVEISDEEISEHSKHMPEAENADEVLSENNEEENNSKLANKDLAKSVVEEDENSAIKNANNSAQDKTESQTFDDITQKLPNDSCYDNETSEVPNISSQESNFADICVPDENETARDENSLQQVHFNVDKQQDNLVQINENALSDIQNSNENFMIVDSCNTKEPSCNKKDEDDDDIFICNSPPGRAPTPELICLDDGTDAEPETEEKYNASFVNGKSQFSPRDKFDKPTNNDADAYNTLPSKNVCENLKMKESIYQNSEENHNRYELSSESMTSVPSSTEKSRKRKLRSYSLDESSDEDVQVVSSVNKNPLSGAKRTFNFRENRNPPVRFSPQHVGGTASSIPDTFNRSQQEKSLSGALSNDESDSDSTNKEQNSSTERIVNSAHNSHNFDAKDIEILKLKRKLGYVCAAFQVQQWKSMQEKAELRHNMNLIVMEMRASLEADKKQAIESLMRTLQQEKNRCVEETKRKQWCAYCHQESRYACCWNTSYCTVACQKRHFPEHRNFCTQLKCKASTESAEVKSKIASSNIADMSENKGKLYLLNMKTTTDPAKPSAETITSASLQQIPLSKPQIQVVSPKSSLQLVTASSSSSQVQVLPNPGVQFVLAPVKSPTESTLSNQPLVTTNEQNLDSVQIINNVRNRFCNLGTAISLLKRKNQELSAPCQEKEPSKTEEADLENVYFPSPPKVKFEGYESFSPDPNKPDEDMGDPEKTSSDTEVDVMGEKNDESAAEEEDFNLSESDDVDNEMVNIGHGVDIKAKFLNKCLIYGKTAKRLTRCLVDVIFPDIKLLASCSAFGQKSNVTKLTRAALPARKVAAIIDFVGKRFPECNRSEIVLAINMKCKEARNILGKKDVDGCIKKLLLRRLLAKEKGSESSTTSDASISAAPPSTTAVTITNKTIPNVVCIKTSTAPVSSTATTITVPKKLNPGPNILRCSPQILIRPKPPISSTGSSTSVVSSKPATKKRETVKNLLSAARPYSDSPKDGTKLVMPMLKAPIPSSPVACQLNNTALSPSRSLIILSPSVSPVRQSLATSVTQNTGTGSLKP